MRRLVPAVLAAVMAIGLGAQPAAAAGDRVRETATSTYELMPSKGHVRVTVETKVTNRVPSTTTQVACTDWQWDDWIGWLPVPSTCPQKTNYYVNETYLWVEAGAKSLRVTADRGTVTFKKAKKANGFQSYRVHFSNIFNGQTRTLKATYILPGGKPRSNVDTRIGMAYANFCAITQPTDAASLRVIVPQGFELESRGGSLKEVTSGERLIFSSGRVKDPVSFGSCLTGTNADGYAREIITSPSGQAIVIEGWPEDAAWMAVVKREAESSIGALEALIGRELPGEGSIVIREVTAAELGDYAGTYTKDQRLARVSERIDQVGLVQHELAHAWFNADLFADNWLREGYAEWAGLAAAGGSASCDHPVGYPAPGSPDLANWQYSGARSTESDLAVIDYQYQAACAIIGDLAGVIGNDRMDDVLGAIADGEIAYEDETAVGRRPSGAADWKVWLDVADERGMIPAGSSELDRLENLLVRYGVAQTGELAGRAEARAAYHAALSDSDGWSAPAAVRQPMAEWDFRAATEALDAAQAAIDAANRTETLLPSVDAASGPVRDAFESAASLADLRAAAQMAVAQADAAGDVAMAVARADAEVSPVASVGLLGTDLGARSEAAVAAVARGDLADATALAQQIDSDVDGAATSGLLRIGFMIAAIAGLAALLVVRRRRGTGQEEAAIPGSSGTIA
jgi:hypothetical protein